MNCEHCNGECCYLEEREGTIRYAQLLPHGKGVHYCKYCDDGKTKEEEPCYCPCGTYEDCGCFLPGLEEVDDDCNP